MSVAKLKVREILKELAIDQPELLRNLKEICCERGAYVREASLEGAEARLTVNGDKGVITVKPNDTYAARTRFSIAHELGHFELHRRGREIVSCDQRALNDWQQRQAAANLEAEANEFAAALLLPEEFVWREFRNEKPGIRVLESVAERYQTSLFATTRRFIELTDEACAAVFFRGTAVQYAWKSKLFDRQNYRITPRIDQQSYAYQAARAEETPDYMSAVEASAWLVNLPPWLEDESLLEEARSFPSLGMGMALLWINRGALIRFF